MVSGATWMSKAGQDLACLLQQLLAIDDAQPLAEHRLASEKNILRDRHVGHEVEFLVDRADPQLLRVVGLRICTGLPSNRISPASGA